MLQTQSPALPHQPAPDNRTARIRELNDAHRKNPFGGLGRLVATHGVINLSDADRVEAMRRTMGFSDFTESNDPHAEHDFGAFDVNGTKIFWKIDYYDKAQEMGSPDPADPAVTCRVLTVLLASEY